MVFWATILAFVIGIMSYMMFPRNDRAIVEYMPPSEAYVSTFVTQHQAAKDYLREALIAINKLPEYAPNPVNNSVIVISPGDNPPEEREGLLPFIPHIQSIMTTSQFKPADNTFASVLGCFNYPERFNKTTGNYFENQLTGCTKEEAQTKYVFTYGPLPDLLDKPFMRKNLLLWEAAILKRTRGNPDCGFLQKRNNRYFINTSSRLTRTIPVSFANLLGSYISTSMPNESIRVNRVNVNGEYDVPLLFCMTPANDPYPRSGLKLLLDSIINKGMAGKHAETLDEIENKWVNLAPQKDGAAQPTIDGTGAWHMLDKSCLENPNCAELSDKSFSFVGGRVVDTKIDQSTFGNSITISMLAMFNSNNSSHAVFGSQSCTPQVGKPCISAAFKKMNEGSGELSISLWEADTTDGSTVVKHRSVISGVVKRGEITQIDYILNSANHRLLINGKQEDYQKFADEPQDDTTPGVSIRPISGFTTLAPGSAFLIGTAYNPDNSYSNWNNGSLYSFIVYNRTLSNDPLLDEMQKNDASFDKDGAKESLEKFDVKGLARIYKTNIARYDYYNQLKPAIVSNSGLIR